MFSAAAVQWLWGHQVLPPHLRPHLLIGQPLRPQPPRPLGTSRLLHFAEEHGGPRLEVQRACACGGGSGGGEGGGKRIKQLEFYFTLFNIRFVRYTRGRRLPTKAFYKSPEAAIEGVMHLSEPCGEVGAAEAVQAAQCGNDLLLDVVYLMRVSKCTARERGK